MTSVKVIAFDLGGVLFSEGKANSAKALRGLGYDAALVQPYLSSAEAAALRRGELTDEQFWIEWLQPKLPKAYDALAVKEAWYQSYILDEEVAALVKELRGMLDDTGKRRYLLATFSGNIVSRVAFLDARYGFRAWFDREVWSYECHMNKPDKRFLQELITRTGAASASEIFYIDDQEKDSLHAPGMGFKLHLYQSGGIRALRERLRAEGVPVAL